MKANRQLNKTKCYPYIPQYIVFARHDVDKSFFFDPNGA